MAHYICSKEQEPVLVVNIFHKHTEEASKYKTSMVHNNLAAKNARRFPNDRDLRDN